MAYRRVASPAKLPKGKELTAAMIGIGMNLADKGSEAPNIEDTLLAASVEGMERDDLRVTAILVTWLRIHHARINADRLIRAVQEHKEPRLLAFWAGVGSWLNKDRRFARLARVYRGRRIDLLAAGTEFQLERRGEDSRFRGTPLRVPAGILRDRDADVLSPSELAKRHRAYRHRVLIGPSYRADMWAMLEQEPDLSPSELARRTYGSFATAWQVKHDRDLLKAA